MPAPSFARSCLAIVLAAGEGTRMRSQKPKVLHELAGASMLAHVVGAVSEAGADAIAVVVGPGRDDVARTATAIAPSAEIFVQTHRLGTAHAVLAARAAFMRGYDDIVIAFADTPLVAAATFLRLRAALHDGADVAILAFEASNPEGYGRIVLDADGAPLLIREQKDASHEEQGITLCNAGLMALAGDKALALLEGITPANAQNEYYLTDAVAAARAAHLPTSVHIADEKEVLGVNDRAQLAKAEAQIQIRLRKNAMRNGVTLIAPETVFLSADTVFGSDIVIEPNVVIGRGVKIEDGAVIHAFSHLEGAHIGAGCSVGPFARLRPGANLGAGAKVGNFVEIKASEVGAGAKISHLSYIGDASIGAQANIGAGTITCNYDGYNKFRTDIGDGAFIGSNSALVAPVRIGAGAFVGSGSVITSDVASDALALGRGAQMDRPGWAAHFRERHAKTSKKPR